MEKPPPHLYFSNRPLDIVNCSTINSKGFTDFSTENVLNGFKVRINNNNAKYKYKTYLPAARTRGPPFSGFSVVRGRGSQSLERDSRITFSSRSTARGVSLTAPVNQRAQAQTFWTDSSEGPQKQVHANFMVYGYRSHSLFSTSRDASQSATTRCWRQRALEHSHQLTLLKKQSAATTSTEHFNVK